MGNARAPEMEDASCQNAGVIIGTVLGTASLIVALMEYMKDEEATTASTPFSSTTTPSSASDPMLHSSSPTSAGVDGQASHIAPSTAQDHWPDDWKPVGPTPFSDVSTPTALSDRVPSPPNLRGRNGYNLPRKRFGRFRDQVELFTPSPVSFPSSPPPPPTYNRTSSPPRFPRSTHSYNAPSLSLPDSRDLLSNNAQYRLEVARRELGIRLYSESHPSLPRDSPGIVYTPTVHRSDGHGGGYTEDNFGKFARPFLLFQLALMLLAISVRVGCRFERRRSAWRMAHRVV